jgi:non-ribosomal peptide synthetase component F
LFCFVSTQHLFVLQRAHRLTEISSFILGRPGTKLRVGALEFESLPILPDTAMYDITLEMAEADGGVIIAALHYNVDLFDAGTIAGYVDNLTTLLQSAASSPYTPVDALSMLPVAQRSLMLHDWNVTRCAVCAVVLCTVCCVLCAVCCVLCAVCCVLCCLSRTVYYGLDLFVLCDSHAITCHSLCSGDWPQDSTLVAEFARVVQRTPNAVAAEAPDGTPITYAQLDAQSNQLARYALLFFVEDSM